MNRLNLDFKLMYIDERVAFVNKYLEEIPFSPTDQEIETISNYILYGKDRETGKNAVQLKEIEIETKNNHWNREAKTESLDALIEDPTFSEFQFINPISVKPKKEKFSRSEARANAPAYILEVLEQLWHSIDLSELIVNYYDLAHGKRKTPPRDELLNSLSKEDIEYAKKQGEEISQRTYLRLRHQIIEKRKEQFTLRDSYASTIMPAEPLFQMPQPDPQFGAEIPVKPFGLYSATSKVFKELVLDPRDFSESEKDAISKKYQAIVSDTRPLYFDFRDENHVYQAIKMFEELQSEDELSTLEDFKNTLNFYVEHSELSDVQRYILSEKINKTQNKDIQASVNAQFGTTYSENYISTIFRQKIIPKICDAARTHAIIIENLRFPKNFKKCNTCGKNLLLDEHFFVRRAISLDGFAYRCKKCDKIKRRNKV